MAVRFIDPLGRGGKPSNITGGVCCRYKLVVPCRAYGSVAVLFSHCRMAVGFLDPIGRGEKTEQYHRWYLLVQIVVLVERADRQSVAGLGPIFLGVVKSRGSRSPTQFLKVR